MSFHSKASGHEENILTKAAIAGGVCAFVSAILNPIDVAKIRMQNQSSNDYASGLRHSLKKIISEEGYFGLAKGLEASMWREVFYSSIRLGGYEPIRRALSYDSEDPAYTSPKVKFFASFLTGVIGAAIANPFDLMKTRFQAVLPHHKLPYNSTWHGLFTIGSTQGFGGLYKGWSVTSARAGALSSAQLGTYDSIKHNLLIKHLQMKEGLFLHFVSSMISGLVTTTATNPFDVIKTRYLGDHTGKYKSIADCIMQTVRQDGMKGFMRGWFPAYLRIGPHTTLVFLFIEEIRTFLGMNNI